MNVLNVQLNTWELYLNAKVYAQALIRTKHLIESGCLLKKSSLRLPLKNIKSAFQDTRNIN